MRERLIELIRNYPNMSTAENQVEAVAEDLADYLIANGVIVPPCKVGDDIWFIVNREVAYGKIGEIAYGRGDMYVYVFEHDDVGVIVDEWSICLCDLGKTVFLTKEEAEKALKERNKENG